MSHVIRETPAHRDTWTRRCDMPALSVYKRHWFERLIDKLHDWMGR